MNLGFDVVDGVAALDLESYGLASQCLDEDLHLLLRFCVIKLVFSLQRK